MQDLGPGQILLRRLSSLVGRKKKKVLLFVHSAGRAEGWRLVVAFFFPSPKVGVGLVERERESCHDRDLYDLLGGVGMEKHLCGCVEVGLSAQWTK